MMETVATFILIKSDFCQKTILLLVRIAYISILSTNVCCLDLNADSVPNYSGSRKRVHSRVGEAQSSAAGKAEKAEVCKKKDLSNPNRKIKKGK